MLHTQIAAIATWVPHILVGSFLSVKFGSELGGGMGGGGGSTFSKMEKKSAVHIKTRQSIDSDCFRCKGFTAFFRAWRVGPP